MDPLSDEEFSDLEDLEPTLQNLLDQKSLKWVFVGGKGGVGKTTTSCSIAMRLAAERENVLLISTDPAHNLSDAFSQKFSGEPSPVKGVPNLFAMEVDPKQSSKDYFADASAGPVIRELATAMPGIDEAMSFGEIIKLVRSLKFSVVVFDTAPTGHTLRLLSFPTTLDKTITKFRSLKSKFGTILGSMGGIFGGENMPNEKDFSEKLEQLHENVKIANAEFSNPDLTTFVCVLIPEFLSIYETERMVQELNKFDIDVHNVVVNQVLYPSNDQEKPCRLCTARAKMQKKYIDQITELYEGLFHVVKMPLLEKEVRGVSDLKNFAQMLTDPYDPKTQQPCAAVAKVNHEDDIPSPAS